MISLASVGKSLLAYVSSAHYLVIVLVIILAYIILKEGLKRTGENHGIIAFVIIALVFGLLLYLHLYLYGLMAFLAMVLIGYYSIKKDDFEAKKAAKHQAKVDHYNRKYADKYEKKYSKGGKP